LSDPGTLPTGDGQGIAQKAGGGIVVAHATTPFVTAYADPTDVLIQGFQNLSQQFGTQTAVRLGGLLQE
jgi:hypothetical protein